MKGSETLFHNQMCVDTILNKIRRLYSNAESRVIVFGASKKSAVISINSIMYTDGAALHFKTRIGFDF